ncbi:MAG: lipopolysaccharide biosynthesis protein [Methylocystis sp.]
MTGSVDLLIAFIRARKTRAAAILALCIKGMGALLTIAIFTLAARAMTTDEFGQLAIWFNAMSFLAVAAVFGQETLIARSWGEYSGRGEHGIARGAYRFGWRTTVASGAVFVVALLAFAPLTTVKIAPATLYSGAAFLFVQTMLHYSSHSSRVIAGFVVSETNRELTWRFILLFAVVWAVFHRGLTPTEFFCAGAAGMMLSILFQSLAVRRHFTDMPFAERREVHRAAWFARSRSMWLSAMVEAASQYADVMLIGYFATPAAAGGYFVTARIANIFPMVMTGLNTYLITHCANLYFSGDIQRLQEIMRSIATTALAFLLPALLAILVFGRQILSIFGERYVSDYPTLVVLSLACFAVSLSGSASGVLLTTGHEKLYARVISVATAMRLALTATLAAKYGALGAACGFALINAPLAVGLTIMCRAVCGVDPSIVNIVSRWRPAIRAVSP